MEGDNTVKQFTSTTVITINYTKRLNEETTQTRNLLVHINTAGIITQQCIALYCSYNTVALCVVFQDNYEI